MIRTVEWSETAEGDLRGIDWKIAADVAAAVKLFAMTGVGTVVRWPNLAGADEHRLSVPPSRYYASIRYSASIVYVERVLFSP